jgi:hypothetical protein
LPCLSLKSRLANVCKKSSRGCSLCMNLENLSLWKTDADTQIYFWKMIYEYLDCLLTWHVVLVPPQFAPWLVRSSFT